MTTQEKYDKAIKHIKNSGLLTDSLYGIQVRNALHIAAFGVGEPPGTLLYKEYIPGHRDKPGLDVFDTPINI